MRRHIGSVSCNANFRHLIRRQELLRRQSPVGVTSGLYQGLTGLGLSVLGAVAGVADQPLQGIFAIAGGEDNLSNMQMLSQVRLFSRRLCSARLAHESWELSIRLAE